MTGLLLPVIYLAFISLGLPDPLLGAAWPVMHTEFGVPLSYAGMISMTIALGTIVSSILSDKMTRRFGAGKVTAVSVAITALALAGFSFSHSFWILILWAVPYGLGAGGVDAALNNYVAVHYSSRHMSWLHCMWGVGTSVGPYFMSYAIANAKGWNMGYRYISVLQVILTVILFFSLPMWKKSSFTENTVEKEVKKASSMRDILKMPGAKEIMIAFFCYCALETASGLWASSFLHLYKGVPKDKAASYAAMFFVGITVGRAISGFITMKLNDTEMIRLGEILILIGVFVMFIPGKAEITLAGLILIGLGCAPIYPCIIHSTPEHFGEDKSQAIIGVQMAFAYMGILLMPPLFGVIANAITVALLPVYILVLLILMFAMHEALNKATR